MFKLFGKGIRENRFSGEVRATQDGIAVPLAEVPDPVIRDGVLGVGVAIIPHNGRVLAPVDGTVTNVARSGHAFCFQTSDGLEVLVHIGVDTVALNGQGFRVHIKAGAHVLAGSPICDVDLSLLAEKNLPAHTAILIPNHTDFEGISFASGEVAAGTSPVIRYQVEKARQ